LEASYVGDFMADLNWKKFKKENQFEGVGGSDEFKQGWANAFEFIEIKFLKAKAGDTIGGLTLVPTKDLLTEDELKSLKDRKSVV
jgi:hypothetical protein